ncbi:hypothetical protein ACT3R7_12080 [Halomonas sp. AOP43-A1-21]
MSQTQTLKIHNPTGEPVAYISRDCRLTVPASSDSTHIVAEGVVARVTAHLERHHPLLSIALEQPAGLEPEPEPEPVPEPAKKPAAPRQTAKASAKAKSSAADQSQEADK